MASLITIIKPYKSSRQNTIDVALYLVAAFGYVGATAFALSPDHIYNKTLITIMGLAGAIPLLYMTTLVLYNLVPKSLIPKLKKCLQRCLNHNYTQNLEDEELFQSIRVRNEETPLLRRTISK